MIQPLSKSRADKVVLLRASSSQALKVSKEGDPLCNLFQCFNILRVEKNPKPEQNKKPNNKKTTTNTPQVYQLMEKNEHKAIPSVPVVHDLPELA